MLGFWHSRIWRRRMFAALVVGLAVLTVVWLDRNRTTEPHPQSQLYEWGTTGPRASFAGSVSPHQVSVPPPKLSAGEILLARIRQFVAMQPIFRVQGLYNPDTEEILVVGDEARYESTLPIEFRPNFYHTLRHEYGHAAFDDWMESKNRRLEAQLYLAYTTPEDLADPADVPKELVPVVVEWKQLPEYDYGMPHFTSTFEEYIAESYARLLEGRPVPPKTRTFLLRQYGGVVFER